MARWSWLIIILTAIINVLFTVSCAGDSSKTQTHWLHGYEYQQFGSVTILWLVGIFFILFDRLKQQSTEIIGYLLILSSTIVAIKSRD